MSDQQSKATFVTELKAQGTAEVKAQASALEKLESTLKTQNATLAKMTLTYKNLKVGGLQNSQTAIELKKRIQDQKKAIGENALAVTKLKGAYDVNTKSSKNATKETRGLTLAFHQLSAGAKLGGGPLASLASNTLVLGNALGKAGLFGVAVAAGGALLALDYIAAKTAVSLASSAITHSNAYRTENLELQGLTKTWTNFWGLVQVAPGNADKMQGAIDRVSGSVGLARSKILETNSALYSMRLRGKNLEDGLKAVAFAEDAAGEKGRQWAMNQIYMNALLGRSVSNVAALAEKRFGGIVKAKMLDLNVQVAKARENWGLLFRGVKVEPLLRGLDKVLGFFRQGTVQAEAWSTIFETLFNPLFRDAEKGGDVIKTFMNKVTILALNASIAWEDMGASFSLQKFGIKDTSDLLVKASTAAGGFAVAMLEAADATLYIAQGLGRIGSAMVGLYQMGKAGLFGDDKNVLENRKNFSKGWDTFKSAFGEQSESAKVGHQLIEGLIKGIQDAQPYLNKAAADSMKEAEKSAKGAAGVRSPSTKWRFNLGKYLPLGAALGVRDETPKLRKAAATALGSIGPSASSSSGGNAISSGNGGGFRGFGNTTVTTGPITFPQAAQNAPGTVTIPIAEFNSFLVRSFEGLAIQRGAHMGART